MGKLHPVPSTPPTLEGRSQPRIVYACRSGISTPFNPSNAGRAIATATVSIPYTAAFFRLSLPKVVTQKYF
ncbi:MAG TPA: hypothetical protein V6D10_22625 [Trichocoleus sp.]